MTREEIALQIFIKRLPNEPLLDSNRAWFQSRVTEAYALADMFRQEPSAPVMEATSEPSELEVEGEQ